MDGGVDGDDDDGGDDGDDGGVDGDDDDACAASLSLASLEEAD